MAAPRRSTLPNGDTRRLSKRNRLTRAASRLDGRRLAQASTMGLGARIRDARKRRSWSLGQLGQKVDLTAARLSQIERGDGVGAPLEIWYALGQALQVPFQADFARDRAEEPLDAGHLGIQDLALRLGRTLGFTRTFELPTRPANPSLSVDVGLRDDTRRLLIIEECWKHIRQHQREHQEHQTQDRGSRGAGRFRRRRCGSLQGRRLLDRSRHPA